MNRKERTKYWSMVCEDYNVDDMDKYIQNLQKVENNERPVVDISKIIINDIFSPRVVKTNNEISGNELERPTWDDYFKEIVQVTRRRSPCERLQVGCLLVKDNRIISQGYNGFLPRCPHKSIVRNNHEQATLHAEQNALMDCAKRGASCKGATAYITHYPCIICCRLLLAADIGGTKTLIGVSKPDCILMVPVDTATGNRASGACVALPKPAVIRSTTRAAINTTIEITSISLPLLAGDAAADIMNPLTILEHALDHICILIELC